MPLLFKTKIPSPLWSCWYCWLLLPWILYSLYTCSLISLLLSWLVFWHLPLLSFQCHVPQLGSRSSSHIYLGSITHQLLFLRMLCSAHLHPLYMLLTFAVYRLNWFNCSGSACPSICSKSFLNCFLILLCIPQQDSQQDFYHRFSHAINDSHVFINF